MQVRFVTRSVKVDAHPAAVGIIALAGEGRRRDAALVEHFEDFRVALPPADRFERRFGQQIKRNGFPFAGALGMTRSAAAPEVIDGQHVAEGFHVDRSRRRPGERLDDRVFAVVVNRRHAVAAGLSGRQRIDDGFDGRGRIFADPFDAFFGDFRKRFLRAVDPVTFHLRG